MIQYQILQTNMMRITWQTVRRINNNILGFVIYETRKLEANWEVIKDEGISLLDQKSGGFIPEEENLREQGDWKQFTLYQRGRKNAAACQKTPQTCAIIDTIKDATSCKRGQVCLEQPGGGDQEEIMLSTHNLNHYLSQK